PSPAARLARVTRYAPSRAGAPVDLHLDGNEGIAPPAALFETLRDGGTELLRRYPDARGLEALLAERHGVAPERVLVTAGADDATDRLCRAVLEPGRELVMPCPSFELLARYAGLAGGDIVEVEWEADYPTAAVLQAIGPRTALIAVVSPNNPTGA